MRCLLPPKGLWAHEVVAHFHGRWILALAPNRAVPSRQAAIPAISTKATPSRPCHSGLQATSRPPVWIA